MANDADLKIEGINGESEGERHRNCTSFAEAAAGMDAQPCRKLAAAWPRCPRTVFFCHLKIQNWLSRFSSCRVLTDN